MQTRLQLAHAFLSAHPLGVLSTLGHHGEPQVSIIEYGQTEACELIFGTFMQYRKYRTGISA